MRTTIVLFRNEAGEWDESLGHIDVSHAAPLSDEAVEAFRALGAVAVERMKDGGERAAS